MKLLGSFVACVCGALGVIACGAAHSAKETTTLRVAAPDSHDELERYFPLQDNTVFSYDTHTEPANPSTGAGLLIVQIRRPRGGRADLRMGSHTERLEIDPEGIVYVEGGYLLKAPLTLGNTWKGRSGAVRITNTDESMTVPAGHFEGCLRTVEETRTSAVSRAVTSIYCPHVGLVTVDAQATTPAGQARETAILKSFGPSVDVAGTDSVTTTTDGDAGPLRGPIPG